MSITDSTIPSISRIFFQKLKIYRRLSLDGIGLIKIKNDTFLNQDDLPIVNIKNNNLTVVERNVFNKISSLEELNLEHNQIKTVEKNSLTGLNKLNELILSSNQLLSIPEDLNTLISLKTLKLDQNNINEIKSTALPLSLMVLDLSHNALKELNCDSLQMVNLTKLYLQNNAINNIQSGCFKYTTSLNELNLSNNNLQQLQYGLFSNVNNMNIFSISNNQLKSLYEDVLMPMNSLKELSFANNRIKDFNVDNVKLHFPELNHINFGGNLFTCARLVQIYQKLKNIKIIKGIHFDVENVEGIPCANIKDEQNGGREFIQDGDILTVLNNINENLIKINGPNEFEINKLIKYLDGLKQPQIDNLNENQLEKLISLESNQSDNVHLNIIIVILFLNTIMIIFAFFAMYKVFYLKTANEEIEMI